MSSITTRIKKPFTKVDAAITAGFFLIGIATRIPFRSNFLFEWDSVGFALGLERFSLAEHQPHPPGYILYIGLGRLINFFVHDANTALVAMSILGSAASIAGMFLLGRSIFERKTGIAAAALMLFSPLNWFYGEIAYTYVVGLALAIPATWFLYELIFARRYAVPAATTLGLAAGFRIDVLLFLIIFFLIGSFRMNRRIMMLSWAALAVSVLAWLGPLIYVTGGISAYFEAIYTQANTGVFQLSGVSGGLSQLITNAVSIASASVRLLGIAIFVLIYTAWCIIFKGWLRHDRRMLFLLLLAMPALVFFFFFIIAVPGYFLVFSAPVVLVAARSLFLISEKISLAGRNRSGSVPDIRAGPLMLASMATIVTLANIGLFLAPKEATSWLPLMEQRLGKFAFNGSYDAISERDKMITVLTDKARQFEAGNTVLLAYNGDDWRRLGYYLPEYPVFVPRSSEFSYYDEMIHHVWTKHEGSLTIEVPFSTERILFMNPGASAEVPQGAQVLNAQLPPVYLVDLPAEAAVEFEGFSIQR